MDKKKRKVSNNHTTGVFSIAKIKTAFRPLLQQTQFELHELEALVDSEFEKGKSKDDPLEHGIDLLCYITAQEKANIISKDDFLQLKKKIESAIEEIDPEFFNNGSPIKPGVIIDDEYFLRREVGSGGMGVVWKAYSLLAVAGSVPDVDSFVAIKFLNQKFEDKLDNAENKPLALKTLVQEFNLTKKLSHENIVQFHSITKYKDMVCIVMEYLQGMPLDEFIESNPQGISLEDAKPIIMGICQGLTYAHEKQLVHLDLKPGNIFYDPHKKSVKIIDFGIAQAINQSKIEKSGLQGFSTTTHRAFGSRTVAAKKLNAHTKQYASLEMLIEESEHTPTFSDDVYALSCIIYELLKGEHPYGIDAVTAKAGELELEPLPNLSKQAWLSLKQGLAFKRKDRLDSVKALQDGLYPPKKELPYQLIAGVSTSGFMLLLIIGFFLWWFSAEPEVSNVAQGGSGVSSVAQSDATKNVADLPSEIEPDTALLTIKTNPEDAQIYVDGELFQSPLENEFEKGRKYQITIEKMGYESWSRTVELTEAQALNATLVKLPENVQFTILRPENIESDQFKIKINDETYSSLPVTAELLKGEYLIEIEAEGYQRWFQTVDITNNESLPLTLKPDLIPVVLVSLIIRSDVVDDKVYINDVFYKSTPVRAKLQSGKYKVRVEKDGFSPIEEEIELGDKEQIFVANFEKKAALIVSTNVDGAKVSFRSKNSNSWRSISANKKKTLSLGKYIVRAEKEGYAILEQEIELEQENQQLSVNLKLAKETVSFAINTKPAQSNFVIVGKNGNRERGSTPVTLQLPPDDYELRLSKPGYRPIKQELSLDEDKRFAINLVQLVPSEKPSGTQLGRIFSRVGKRSLSGYVTVQYMVARDGSVKDPKVIDASHRRIFDEAAIKAIKMFKYEPVMEDGQPIEAGPVTYRFKLE